MTDPSSDYCGCGHVASRHRVGDDDGGPGPCRDCHCIEYYEPEPLPVERETGLREALAELVRLKGLKDAAKRGGPATWTPQEKDAAWDNAKAALAPVQGDAGLR